jgi:hypothetical protein
LTKNKNGRDEPTTDNRQLDYDLTPKKFNGDGGTPLPLLTDGRGFHFLALWRLRDGAVDFCGGSPDARRPLVLKLADDFCSWWTDFLATSFTLPFHYNISLQKRYLTIPSLTLRFMKASGVDRCISMGREE